MPNYYELKQTTLMELEIEGLIEKIKQLEINIGIKELEVKQLKMRIPIRILEKAIKGMLPKGVLGRQYFRRLFVYEGNDIVSSQKGKKIISAEDLINNSAQWTHYSFSK
jgi:ribosomal protein L13